LCQSLLTATAATTDSAPSLHDALPISAEASDVGDGGTTGAVAVTPDSDHAISEAAGATSPTTLGDYTSTTSCTKNGQPYLTSSGDSKSTRLNSSHVDMADSAFTYTSNQ